jgi:TPP-dependent pyruvate/acetoin dehydrogenase alpha subunit
MDLAPPLTWLRTMMIIRALEDHLLGRSDCGFQLLSSGQEAVSAGLASTLIAEDQLLSSGRSIGPALARGLDPGAVLAELTGKVGGPNRGKGGRGHLADPSRGFFGAHAVVGGNISIAAGVALAFQHRAQPSLVACMFGDGACASGALHETLNHAAVWRLPLLFVCDNNQYSISTHRREHLAPRLLSDLAQPFGIPGVTVDGQDFFAVRQAALTLTGHVRSGKGPAFLECQSERFTSHSTSTRELRSDDEMARIKARCPIALMTHRLEQEGRLDGATLSRIEGEVAATVVDAARAADQSAYPDPAEALTDVI